MLMHIWLTDEFFCFGNQQDSDLLNLGTGSVSWFEVNGYGCRPTYSTNITSEDPFRLVRPEYVEDCFLNYPTIEITHSAVQLVLAVLGLIASARVAMQIYKGGMTFETFARYWLRTFISCNCVCRQKAWNNRSPPNVLHLSTPSNSVHRWTQ